VSLTAESFNKINVSRIRRRILHQLFSDRESSGGDYMKYFTFSSEAAERGGVLSSIRYILIVVAIECIGKVLMMAEIFSTDFKRHRLTEEGLKGQHGSMGEARTRLGSGTRRRIQQTRQWVITTKNPPTWPQPRK
jgi:hypothetical protein